MGLKEETSTTDCTEPSMTKIKSDQNGIESRAIFKLKTQVLVKIKSDQNGIERMHSNYINHSNISR